MRKVLLLLVFIGLITLTGCSSKILLPYEEKPICSLGKEGGYCGSLSDVYNYIEKEEYK